MSRQSTKRQRGKSDSPPRSFESKPKHPRSPPRKREPEENIEPRDIPLVFQEKSIRCAPVHSKKGSGDKKHRVHTDKTGYVVDLLQKALEKKVGDSREKHFSFLSKLKNSPYLMFQKDSRSSFFSDEISTDINAPVEMILTQRRIDMLYGWLQGSHRHISDEHRIATLVRLFSFFKKYECACVFDSKEESEKRAESRINSYFYRLGDPGKLVRTVYTVDRSHDGKKSRATLLQEYGHYYFLLSETKDASASGSASGSASTSASTVRPVATSK